MKTSKDPFKGKIIVTTDFSEVSYAGFSYALNEAQASGAELTVVHALEEPVPLVPLGDNIFPLESIVEMRAAALAGAEKRLTDILTKHFSGTSATKYVLRNEGSIADIIADYAMWNDIGLIVMASQGHSFLGRLFIGSVAERVLRRMPCPVLLVPATGEKTKRHVPYKKILVTTDLSKESYAAFPFVQYEAERTGASVSVAHVVESVFAPELLHATLKDDPEAIQNRYRQGLEKQIKEVASKIGIKGVTSINIDKSYTTPNTIHTYANDHDIDLIVIASQGARSGFGILGGTTERIMREAPCPVLMVPSRPSEKR